MPPSLFSFWLSFFSPSCSFALTLASHLLFYFWIYMVPISSSSSFIYLFFCFLGLHQQHMEVPRLGVESELLLPAYITAAATQNPSCICNLHHSSRQHRILNPLREARDRTLVFMDTSQICFHWTMMGTPWPLFLFLFIFIFLSFFHFLGRSHGIWRFPG